MSLTFTLILSTAVPMAPVPANGDQATCALPTMQRVATQRSPRMSKLGEQPPAIQIYALARLIHGCNQPIVLREKVGR